MSGFDGDRAYSRGAPASSAVMDLGLRAFMIRVYNYMAAGLGVTAVCAWLVSLSPGAYQLVHGQLRILFFLAPLGIVIWMGVAARRMSPAGLRALFFVYAAMMGAWLSALVMAYTPGSMVEAFVISTALFAGMSLYGYTTKKDLSSLGSFLVMGVWGILIALVVNWFLQSPALDFALSVIAVLVFTGLTAWDTQKTKAIYDAREGADDLARASIYAALSLYLDFLNLFIFLLRFVGVRRS